MLLTKHQFKTKRSHETLRIALIGMSNIGKSYCAHDVKKRHGFEVFEADKAIQNVLGLDTIDEAAHWMGHPYESGYKQKSKQYLDLEGEVTLSAQHNNKNLVLDTTGSVVHLAPLIHRHLKSNYLIVYLQANTKNIDVLIDRFSSSPKPLIWSDHYVENHQLSKLENLMASYPTLLKVRANLYEKLADITVNITQLEKPDTDFLSTLCGHLPN